MMTTSNKKRTASRIKRRVNRVKRKSSARIRKAANTAGLKVSRTSRRKRPRSASTHLRRANKAAHRTKKAARQTTRHHSNSPTLFGAAIDEAIKVETSAVQIAGQVGLLGLDVLERATNLLLAPAILLDAAMKPGRVKVLPWPEPAPLKESVAPLASAAA